ncbi:hypothetical protein D9M69_625060 [compost metagenome]
MPSWSSLSSDFFAACSSSLTASRVIATTLLVWSLGALLAGITSRRTTEPLGPRISLTTSSRRQPITSTISPLPWATPTILSAGATCLLFSAGPAGTRRTIFT